MLHLTIPIILGSMDPLVVPDDDAKLMDQVHYLDAMQSAMNSSVHRGGSWTWRSQALGLIDSLAQWLTPMQILIISPSCLPSGRSSSTFGINSGD